MNTEMENGSQMTLDQWMPDLFRGLIAGASEHLARTSALQEPEPDLMEIGHPSFERYFASVKKLGKKIDPNGLSMRMLRECYQATEDLTSLPFSLKWGGAGYDIEWFDFNSKYHGVPQNRERIYTVGHLRAKGKAKIFPIKATNREDSIQCEVDIIGHRNGYRRNTQVFGEDGVIEALDTAAGGGRGHHVAIPITASLENGIKIGGGTAQTLMARDYKGIGNQDMTAVMIPISREHLE